MIIWYMNLVSWDKRIATKHMETKQTGYKNGYLTIYIGYVTNHL